jgi:hypothetical protein
MLDKVEPGWIIVKPDPLNPCDIETECIFQHGYKEVKIPIGNELFQHGKLEEIEKLVYQAIKDAQG